MHGAPAALAASMAMPISSSDVWVSMMIASAPAFDQRPGLFLVGRPRLVLRQVAVRFQNRAERTEVAEHKTLAPAKRFARDADARPG